MPSGAYIPKLVYPASDCVHLKSLWKYDPVDIRQENLVCFAFFFFLFFFFKVLLKPKITLSKLHCSSACINQLAEIQLKDKFFQSTHP